MRTPLKTLTTGLAFTTLSSVLLAQAEAPPPSPPETGAPAAALFDPQQFPASHGEIDRLTLTGRGDIDGFVLRDGTEVKTAPELGLQIAFAIKPGDRVTVHGLKAAALPLVRAVSVTDERSHRTMTDAVTGIDPPRQPAPPPPVGPAPLAGFFSETSGKVQMVLHGPQGEVNGVLLEGGNILRFPPDQTSQLAAVIQPHQAIVAEGISTTNALGTVVEVQELGPSRDRLVAVGPPPRPIDDRGPAGPGRRPPPPSERGAPPPPPAVAPYPGAPMPPASSFE